MRPLATTPITLAAGGGVATATPEPTSPHQFFFTRAVYTSDRQSCRGGFGNWAIDYPKADRQFLVVLRRLAKLDAYESKNAVRLEAGGFLVTDDDLFSSFYNIEELVQVPDTRNGIAGWGTSERDGSAPFVKGIRDDDGRLMVIVNWNTDLGDAPEHAENPRYPLRYSTYAYLNMIIYAMTR